MKNKIVILFLLSLFVFTSLVSAKPNSERMKNSENPNREEMMEKMHKKHLDRLTEELKLTDEQRTKVDEVLRSGWKEMQKEKESFRKEIKEIRDKYDKKIQKILDNEQKSKFVEICKKMEEHMKKKFGFGRNKNCNDKGSKNNMHKGMDDKDMQQQDDPAPDAPMPPRDGDDMDM